MQRRRSKDTNRGQSVGCNLKAQFNRQQGCMQREATSMLRPSEQKSADNKSQGLYSDIMNNSRAPAKFLFSFCACMFSKVGEIVFRR